MNIFLTLGHSTCQCNHRVQSRLTTSKIILAVSHL
ncbi:hypothetical protein VPHF86_0223 [Vibrio phage F86]